MVVRGLYPTELRIKRLTGPSSRQFAEDCCAGQTGGAYDCGRARTTANCN
jgi:hypothetical protein